MKKQSHLVLKLKLKLSREAVRQLQLIPLNTLDQVNGGTNGLNCSVANDVCTTPH